MNIILLLICFILLAASGVDCTVYPVSLDQQQPPTVKKKKMFLLHRWYFCECGEVIKMGSDTLPSFDVFPSSRAPITCPKCGTTSSWREVKDIGENVVEELFSNHFLNGPLLTVTRGYMVYKVVNNHLARFAVNDRMTVNLATGRSFIFPTKVNGKKILARSKFWDSTLQAYWTKGMRDISYVSPYAECFRLPSEVDWVELKQRFMPYTVVQRMVENTNDLAALNRYPYLSKEQAKGMLLSSRFFDMKIPAPVERLRRELKHDIDPSEYIRKAVPRLNTPKLRKLVVNEPQHVLLIHALSRYFNSAEVIQKFLSDAEQGRTFENYLSMFVRAQEYSEAGLNLLMRKLLKLDKVEALSQSGFHKESLKLRERAELETFKKLSKTSSWLFLDSAAFVLRASACGMELEDWYFAGSIREIHDRLMALTKNLRDVNRAIIYTKKERLLERQYGDVAFRLAEDTRILVTVGNHLSICVGGYDDRALAKQSIIVLLENLGDVVGCIELNGSKVRQVKARFNRCFEGSSLEVVRLWVKDCNLSIETQDLSGERGSVDPIGESIVQAQAACTILE